MSDIAIRVQNLSKQYRIGGPQASYKTLRESLSGAAQAPIRRAGRLLRGEAATDHQETIWALKDVSFEVKHGEVLGIIGRNGAGKSTLLKILSRITAPTEGTVDLYGRVGSLLEVGTGFHPELTGRENIYLNGAILGMKRAEIDRKFDEMVDFAELEKFLDTPVKHYSSGMYVRLAFAVAAHLDPEILLVDEVLAVGDAAFQKKCLGKMGEVAGEGRTVLFVSHNMGAIQRLCSRCVVLNHGMLETSGSVDESIEVYLTNIGQLDAGDIGSRQDRKGDGAIRFTSVSLLTRDGCSASAFLSGDALIIRLGYSIARRLPSNAVVLVGVSVKDRYDDILFLCSNELTGEVRREWPACGEVCCTIPELPLSSGTYHINIYVDVNGVVSDWVLNAAAIEVESADFFGTGRLPSATHARFLVPHSWSISHLDCVESYQLNEEALNER